MSKSSKKKKAYRQRAQPVNGSFANLSKRHAVRIFVVDVWVAVILATVAFCVYLPSLRSDFVYDARQEMLKEGFITSISHLPEVLSLEVLATPHLMLGPRPGQLFYLMLLAAIFGKAPFGFHLASCLLHAANVAFLFFLLRRLVVGDAGSSGAAQAWRARVAAAIVTLFFALHPLAVESVAEVSFSSSLLVTFFTLLALLAATVFRPGDASSVWVFGTAGTFFAFAAVTCKESGIASACLLAVYWFIYRRSEAGRPWFWFQVAASGVTGAFLAARFYFAPVVHDRLSYLGGAFWHVFTMQPRLWVFMFGKLVWPAQLSADYTSEDIDVSLPVALIVLVSVVAMQAWLARRSRMGALGVAIYWLGLVTVSNFVPLYRPEADRFYYLPLAGIAMQLLALLLLTIRMPRLFLTGVGLLAIAILPLTWWTLQRQPVFASDLSLWTHTVQVSPYSTLAHGNLGAVLLQNGEATRAIEEEEEALKLDPKQASVLTNLGNALFKLGRDDEAATQYRRAMVIDPDYGEAYNSLGIIFSSHGQYDQAIEQFQLALKTGTRFADAQGNLGLALYQKGQIDEAIDHFQKSLEINADYAPAHYGIGLALAEKGQLDEAINHFGVVLKTKPEAADVRNSLGLAFLRQGRVADAIMEFNEVLRRYPDNQIARENLVRVKEMPVSR